MSAFVLSAVDPMTVLWSALVLLALAAVFGVLLAVMGKKFAVRKDEKEEEIRRHLSGANCGACGYAGCDAFAKALAEGKADVNSCSATAPAEKKMIGEIMGVAVDAEATKIVVACNGGNDANDKYEYMGYGDCRSMELLGGGRKVCPWGCLGMGSCTDACPVHAIEVGEHGYAEVDREKCITCGKCVAVCPKHLVKRVPASAKVYIACSNCLRQGSARHVLEGLSRVRAVREGVSRTRHRDAGQSARDRLREMRRVRTVRVQMPVQVHKKLLGLSSPPRRGERGACAERSKYGKNRCHRPRIKLCKIGACQHP